MQIRIRSYPFTLAEPFRAGTVLTKGEAQALNALRAENIRNNVARVVHEAIAVLPEGTLLASETLAQLQARITQYDLSYQFLERHEPKARPGAIEAEARAIAQDGVLARRRQAGETLEGPEAEAEIDFASQSDAVLALARARVEARARVSASALEELL
jgi:hypothetical protein